MTDTNLFAYVYQFAAFFIAPLLAVGVAFVFRDALMAGVSALIELITPAQHEEKIERRYYGPSNLVKRH